MRRELEQDGSFAVELSEDGTGCLSKLAHGDYHLLLLDYNLPEADGPEVTELVSERGHGTPVVSGAGKGTTFIVELPIVEVPPEWPE